LKHIAAALDSALAGVSNNTLAVAVSGGGDSMALLHLLAARGPNLRAVTVDHRLRAESAAEARMVGETCRKLGVAHDILEWQGWDHTGNTQAEARSARLRLISDWAHGVGVGQVALAHTLEDQAETLLIRLMRGSGVDGLSGMAAERTAHGLTWLRPLLEVRREALRDYLREIHVTWVDDPSNDDPHYTRVKIRQTMQALRLEPEGLAATATRLQMARKVLERDTSNLAAHCVTTNAAGEVILDPTDFDAAPEELRLRLLAAILRWISGAPYRPRLDNLRTLLADLATTSGQTLHGCVVRRKGGMLWFRREYAQVPPPVSLAQTASWDGRWTVEAGEEAPPASHLGALGKTGLAQLTDWRECGIAREALLTTPTLWQGETLVAAPLAGRTNGWDVKLTPFTLES